MDEQEMIETAFDDLIKSLRKGTTEESVKMIRRAFEFAREAHQGVRRKSGEPYILHPLAVAKIAVKEIGLGTKSAVAALLHDVVEDTDYTVEDIANLFGPKIASLVDGLTKISEVMGSNTTKQAESFRKMILTLADDVRVILIKIADRLHNMRTLDSMPEHKQVKIASETLYIYAPLAHRMGLHAIKTELEDLSLKYENPVEYQELEKRIHDYRDEHTGLYQQFIAPIRERLTESGYRYDITARTKSVYSVWSKMQRRHISFEEIYDLLAVRIVFDPKDNQPEKWQCWNIYSLITDMYSPKPERIRDWVSVPKANGYEALHLTVMGPGGKWIEVQIRSRRMDEIAEKGLAAHWKYKGDNAEASNEVDKWLAGIKEMLEQPGTDALEFLDEFKLNLFAKEIRVFTPKGEMRTLPKGASVLDFAYDIHTEIGNSCIGGKVNHKLVPMSHRLQSGDQVEVLTSDKQKPQSDWLDFIVTAKARNNILMVFRREKKEQIRIGTTMFEKLLEDMKLPFGAENLNKALLHLKLQHKDDLYVSLAKGHLDIEEVRKALKKKSENKFVKYWKLQFFKSDKDKSVPDKEEEKGKVINDITDDASDFIIAPCCNPIPGDDVVGMKIDGDKITVHKRKCPEAIRLMSSYGDKIVPVKWVSHKIMSFLAVIKLNGIDSIGIVSDITMIISKESNVNMRTVHFETKDGIFEGMIHLYVHNTADLNNLMMKIASLKGVENVSRVENLDG
ncbi:bifunctional (p)ppGpp synthetase/guanosine-3',5'-bis(diphosphate) 3'-pyrophosphohydrolase [Butyricimonas virosa]|uniref:Bifunctional (P)ppGpp synthetase/guanosine-3',5'-bis(Diphosphate) 3'-pyrophosphohydrolase n=1 Tax=Butyricimonas virosa TaxID=544645 RepID=A0A413INB9_9BACT|nr:RelA/SpoT family protein [Butyricimonas virosa]MCI7162692.1 RelA/SpoT family protein [Butyricimonas virosa]MDY5013296.1 RelA/SpoT family protein [Butyricimonas virosa]RGL84940.1 bifunctional (p)ppGpp synthetase/guanosine-3',5'-bis(diphosphate) 3'-pyrophosphohydrolase [Butyricimonas virosa]RGY17832.1 bifunctional (p)ppGpp synthetase/guanosine-3',5'-bis(diphosphate) 3'-pyrophosphohydrolase [Butyricimonas virosa]RHI16854.1 bifunctional (p)ppGpp synthetase/guanosine-3',5'-bis(diphosphate) 3'-py